MTLEAWTTLAVICVCLALMVRDKTAPSAVLFGGAVFLMLVGVVNSQQALSGFANPAPFTVAALYVVARAIGKTGGLQPLVRGTMGGAKGRFRRLVRLLVPVGAASAVLNNTPIVAMLTPEVADFAERKGEPASWYLMPLSFAAILGGLITVIGTSTTVVVSGLLESIGEPPLRMFEVTPLGLPIAVAGLVFLAALAPRILPVRRASRRQFSDDVREFTVNMRVSAEGPLDGLTVEAAGLRALDGVFLVSIHREDEVVVPVGPEFVLHGQDLLTFAGQSTQVLDLQSKPGLISAELEHSQGYHGAGHTYFEVVIGPASPSVGRTLREIDFRSRYQAAVLAIHRAGERVPSKLGAVPLQPGDTLRLIADGGFKERWMGRTDFLLVAGIGGLAPTRSREAWWVVAIMAGIVLFAGTGIMPILHASLLGAVLI
ncbi:MAG: SLC13 family permease, partial [Longimicrobiales bacterium]